MGDAGRWCSAAVWLERGQQLERLESGVPTAVRPNDWRIGDGHERHRRAQGATRTAVAIDPMEQVLGERLVGATHRQVPELREWAKHLDGSDRIWVIESAGGLGYLLAQQLVAAGETVVDIPATFASRVRLLGTGRCAKNDPNDARSVASAALRAAELVAVRVEDHASVLRLLSRRHTQLGWLVLQRDGVPAACTAG
jgi:hypothetical protein